MADKKNETFENIFRAVKLFKTAVVAHSASSAPSGFRRTHGISAGPTVLSKLKIAWGIHTAADSQADPVSRISGGTSALESALSGAARAVHYLESTGSSVVAPGATASALATTAGFFSMASMVVAQFSLLGTGKAQALAVSKANGERDGYNLGFAAGATGADFQWVKETFAEPFLGLPSADSGERTYVRSYLESLVTGWEKASELTPEQMQTYQKCIIEAAVESETHWGGSGSDYTNLVFGMARTAEVVGEACDIDEDEVLDDLSDDAILEFWGGLGEGSDQGIRQPSIAVDEPDDSLWGSDVDIDIDVDSSPHMSMASDEPHDPDLAGETVDVDSDEPSELSDDVDEPGEATEDGNVENDHPDDLTSADDEPDLDIAEPGVSDIIESDAVDIADTPDIPPPA